MPRGSKPGERRGGRQKGTPNKRTALARAIVTAALDSRHFSALDLNLFLMRHGALPLKRRVEAALAALPYVHVKLRRKAKSPPRRRPKNQPNDSDEQGTQSEDTEQSTRRSIASRPRVKTTRIPIEGAAADADITPLRFLQKAMWSNATPAELRLKISEQILPYTYYKPSGQPGEAEAIADSGAARAVVLKDQFGFDPELIVEVWKESIKLGRMQQVATGTMSAEEEFALIQRQKQRQAELIVPEDYTDQEFEKDLDRRRWLISKHRSKQAHSKLSAQEKAEYTHVSARIHARIYGRKLSASGLDRGLREDLQRDLERDLPRDLPTDPRTIRGARDIAAF